MTTKYVVKKCNSFGFAVSIEEGMKLYGSGVYLCDGTLENVQDMQLIHSIDSIPSNLTTLYVRLGKEVNKPVDIPVEGDDYELVKDDTQLLEIYNSDEPYINKIPREFINQILEIYPKTKSTTFRHKLLDLLQFNHVNVNQLILDYPFEYTTENVDMIVNDDLFNDIEVSTDKNDNNISTTNYKPDKDALKNAALGNTTQLDAFSENKFAVIHTKKNCGIENKTRSMNHDIIDTLAVNGVIRAPSTTKPLSIYNLMRKLETLNNFNICFIHPSYELKRLSAECPCEQIIPAYHIGEGEILAVAYRYICLWFFGYCSIFTDSMLEYRYAI